MNIKWIFKYDYDRIFWWIILLFYIIFASMFQFGSVINIHICINPKLSKKIMKNIIWKICATTINVYQNLDICWKNDMCYIFNMMKHGKRSLQDCR